MTVSNLMVLDKDSLSNMYNSDDDDDDDDDDDNDNDNNHNINNSR